MDSINGRIAYITSFVLVVTMHYHGNSSSSQSQTTLTSNLIATVHVVFINHLITYLIIVLVSSLYHYRTLCGCCKRVYQTAYLAAIKR